MLSRDFGCSLLSDLTHPLDCSIPVPEAWTTSRGLLSLSPLLPHKVSLRLCFSSSHKYKHVRMGSGLGLGSRLFLSLSSLIPGRGGSQARAGEEGSGNLKHSLSQLLASRHTRRRESPTPPLPGSWNTFSDSFPWARKDGGLPRDLIKHCVPGLTPCKRI